MKMMLGFDVAAQTVETIPRLHSELRRSLFILISIMVYETLSHPERIVETTIPTRYTQILLIIGKNLEQFVALLAE